MHFLMNHQVKGLTVCFDLNATISQCILKGTTMGNQEVSEGYLTYAINDYCRLYDKLKCIGIGQLYFGLERKQKSKKMNGKG